MAVGITVDTFKESSYITVAEYKNAPTSIDYNNLVVGGNQAAQDAELANVILRASSYLNEYLNQNLNATTITETQRTRVTPAGYLAVHPTNSYVIALTDFQYGITPNNLTAIPDCSTAWFENQQIIIPTNQTTYSSQGPLSFGAPSYTSNRLFIKYTYIAGFVNSLATGSQAASSLTVSDATGIVAGQSLRISDGASSESVIVASNYVFGSTTVPLESPLAYAHAGVSISNLPNAIKEAAILMTTAFLKIRGDSSMTMMATVTPSAQISGAEIYGREIKLALDMVDKYRRIR